MPSKKSAVAHVSAPSEAPIARIADTAAWLPRTEVLKWVHNPRLNEQAIPKVAASIRQFGFVAPLIVWVEQNRMVAGHTRLGALDSILAVEPTFVPRGAPEGVVRGLVPVRFHSFASEAEADAYAVADNRLNELATWDVPALQGIMGTLDQSLITVSGFDPSQFQLPILDLTPPTDLTPPEEKPKKERNPNAQVIHYDLVFENLPQQEEWNHFLKHIRVTYPGEETIAGRILVFLKSHGVTTT